MGRAAADAVLSAMLAEPGRYGMDLVERTGLASGVLYPTLVRLERRGLVEADWTPAGRRTYRLTADGVTAVGAVARPVDGGAGDRAGGWATDRAGGWATDRAGGWAGDRSLARRCAWWVPALVIAAIESAAALCRPIGDRLPDLGVYAGAVAGLRHGASLYDFMNANEAPFTYPPFAGLLLWPLSFGAALPWQIGWTCATLATVVVLSILVARAILPVQIPAPPWRRLAPAIAAVLLLSAPVSSDLRFGQVSVGLAALVAVDVLVLGRHRYHGALTGLAAAVKLTPLIFIPMLWLAGRRTAAIVAASVFVACGVLAGAVLPGDSWRFWGTEMWRVSRLGHIASGGNQSLAGALMRLGVADPVRSLLVLAVAGPVAAMALRRAAWLGRHGDWLSATTVVGAAGIVVSPVSWTHHQLWSVLAAMLPVAGTVRARLLWRAGVLAVMVLPVTALGTPVLGNARMLTAVAVACLVPFRPVPGTPRRPHPPASLSADGHLRAESCAIGIDNV